MDGDRFVQEAVRESSSKSETETSPAAVDYSPANERPLVSAIMPTYGRPELVNESVAMCLAQDYENKELIILNDCVGQTFELDHPLVSVLNHPHRFSNLGEKRNHCIEQTSGEIIAIWDDDDAYLPWRLSISVEAMLRERLSFYRPAEFWAYWGDDSLHDNQSAPGWVNHAFSVLREGCGKQREATRGNRLAKTLFCSRNSTTCSESHSSRRRFLNSSELAY
jgi:cellulose synthase/poly-beta-1,6-N-acetylglucosamine synthase-like glycosyltransferase